MSWEFLKLKDSSLKFIDGDRSTKYPKKSEFKKDGVIFLNAGSISGGRFDISSVNYISQDKYDSISKGRAEPNDVIITTRGNGVGQCFFYNGEYGNALINAQMLIIRADLENIHPKFLYYSFISESCQRSFLNYSSGSAQPQLPISSLKEIEIVFPPLETQKRIASILSTYDDLIENNLKRIKLLEETTQNIYKEWFVNFRFPNYEHTEFDNESGLPVGWEITELEHLVTLRQGFALNKKSGHHISNEVTEYPLLKISDLFNDTETLFVKNSIPKQFLVDEEEIIFSRTGQVGHAFMGRKGVIYNNCFRVIANKNINTYFLFSTMLVPSFVSYAKGLATGAAQPDLNHSAFKSIKITNPSIALQNEFSLIFKKNLQLKYCLKNQNQKLKEARDILLPRLMNRTIEV